jgi:hypothetical protein
MSQRREVHDPIRKKHGPDLPELGSIRRLRDRWETRDEAPFLLFLK